VKTDGFLIAHSPISPQRQKDTEKKTNYLCASVPLCLWGDIRALIRRAGA
jgi:hypothetical protein